MAEHRLSDEDIARIASAIRGNCQCNLSHDAQRELGHLMGMIKDVGRDSYSAGIEVIRENNSYLSKYKRRGEKIGLAIVTFICVSLVGGVIYFVKVGVQTFMGGGGK